MKILKEHWERAKIDNENQILNLKITIEFCKAAIKICDEKIAAFPIKSKKFK